MIVVAGATGNTGGAVARELLARGAPLRVLVRDAAKGESWRRRGAEVAVADLADGAALAAALAGAEAAYVLNPPAYALEDLFAHAAKIADAVAAAAERAGLRRLVVLSSIGAHLPEGTGIIGTNRTFERRLAGVAPSVTFLRPAYFLTNWGWVAGTVAGQGILPSFLAPTSRAIPMVAPADIGRAAADALLGESPGDGGEVELCGPRALSPDDVAAAFAAALGRPVAAVAVPESEWAGALTASGFSARTIAAWTELFRAFNSGLVAFEGGEAAMRHGAVSLEAVVGPMVAPLLDAPPAPAPV